MAQANITFVIFNPFKETENENFEEFGEKQEELFVAVGVQDAKRHLYVYLHLES